MDAALSTKSAMKCPHLEPLLKDKEAKFTGEHSPPPPFPGALCHFFSSPSFPSVRAMRLCGEQHNPAALSSSRMKTEAKFTVCFEPSAHVCSQKNLLACFSVPRCGYATLLRLQPPRCDAALPPEIIVALHLLVERNKGRDSAYHEWIQTLQTAEEIGNALVVCVDNSKPEGNRIRLSTQSLTQTDSSGAL